jgi:hypothetical protein
MIEITVEILRSEYTWFIIFWTTVIFFICALK